MKNITRAWLARDTEGALPATGDNLERARAFVFGQWQARAAERGEPAPNDLSGACKFSTLFVKLVFGGRIEGQWSHQYNVVDGAVVDLNRDAADVRGLAQPHWHDPVFFGNPDHLDSLQSCLPRVGEWAEKFAESFQIGKMPALRRGILR